MATITVDVQDKKLRFFKELINQLPFVQIREDETSQPASPVGMPHHGMPHHRRSGIPADVVGSTSENTTSEDTDERVIANIREGVRQMRLVEQGKMKATPFKDFLKELDEL